ncbi:MAG TPA: gluconokinase [Solirubrobacteraceae bacterium]
MNGPANVVLGVDIGTTSAKTVAFDADARELGRGETGYPLLEPEPGQAVQDPAVVVEGTLAAIRAAAAGARDQGARIAALSFSGALHSLVGLDAQGRALTPLVTWGDMRATEQAERLRAEHPELHDRTGTPLHPMSPLPKLVWFAENEPETFAAVRRWVGIKELVVARLTGAWAVDHSVASGTGLLDLRALDWDREALAIAGIDAEALSPLVPTTHRLELDAAPAADLGLEGGLALIVGAADGPLATLGLGAVRHGVAACSIGTSGALRVMVEQPAVDPQRRVFCYALVPGHWIVGGAINNGGAVLRWAGEALAPDLGPHPEARLLELAGEVPTGSEGLLMLPYLLSERAPHWSSVARGAYVGLTRRHGRGHLVRAAVEGVCLQLALVLASVRDAGNEVREIRATGGFARSDLWRQMLADALGMPIGFAAGREGSALGAALLAMDALGLVDGIDRAAQLVHIEDVVEPEADAAAVYADLLPTFAALYDALTPAFHALERHR